MKKVPVEYIESGAFQGGEEDTSLAGIEYGEHCYVVKREDFKRWCDALKAIAGGELESCQMIEAAERALKPKKR
jgi:hypothetical protein